MTRPGLAKVRRVPPFGTRRVSLIRAAPPATAELLASADVVSEGAERDEDAAVTYYGTSSFLFATVDDLLELGALAVDPHLRLLVVRRAREEVAARASGPVGSVRAEVAVRRVGGRLELLVEVCAVIRRAARARG